MNPPLVLVADDEPDIRAVVAAVLEELAGWRVEEASSGRDALEAIREVQPDAVLLDVMMPGMDGPAVVEALRADPETADLPVVLLTAKGQTRELERLRELPVTGVLAKPFDPVTFPAELAALLGWET